MKGWVGVEGALESFYIEFNKIAKEIILEIKEHKDCAHRHNFLK
jgi:hypothetical protein